MFVVALPKIGFIQINCNGPFSLPAQICTIAEPSSVFLTDILPYLPVIFDLWTVTKHSNSDFRYELRDMAI